MSLSLMYWHDKKTVVLKVRDELRISLKGQSYESLLQNQKSFVNFGLSKGGEGREICTSFADPFVTPCFTIIF
jgi:hypothetical protein